MDFSKHVTGTIETHYAYYEYELLNESQRDAQKGELQCYGCTAPTKFTQSSRNGRQAYFSLMPGSVHDASCEVIKQSSEGAVQRRNREEKHYLEAVEKIRNLTGEIDIDTATAAQFETLKAVLEKSPRNENLKSQRDGHTNPPKRHTLSSDNIRASRKNLVQLLKFCLYSSRFIKDGGLTLNFKGRRYYTNQSVKQFFQVGSIQNYKKPYFFFGSIRGVDDGLTYIYVGASKTRVIIDEGIRTTLWNALKVDQYWQLIGAQMICFGWLNTTDGKHFIIIKDIADIALIDIKDNPNFNARVQCRELALTETSSSNKVDGLAVATKAVLVSPEYTATPKDIDQSVNRRTHEPILQQEKVMPERMKKPEYVETTAQKVSLPKGKKSLLSKVLSFLKLD